MPITDIATRGLTHVVLAQQKHIRDLRAELRDVLDRCARAESKVAAGSKDRLLLAEATDTMNMQAEALKHALAELGELAAERIELVGERDRARDLAVRLEAELAVARGEQP